MKRNIFFAMLFCALILCACQKQENTLEKVRAKGSIDVVTILSRRFSEKNPNTQERSGFMIELADSVFAGMGRINWIEVTWGTAAGVLKSRGDVVAAELYVNKQRSKVVDFLPLFLMGFDAVVRKDDLRFRDMNNVFGLNNPKCKIVVSTGEAADPWVHANLPQASIKRIAVESSDNTRFLLEILSGRADVGIAGTDATDEFVTAHPEVTNLFTQPSGLTLAGWAVKKHDTEWHKFLKAKLNSLAERGVLHQLEEKYKIRVVHK